MIDLKSRVTHLQGLWKAWTAAFTRGDGDSCEQLRQQINDMRLERIKDIDLNHQVGLECVLDELAETRRAKVHEYSESRYEESDPAFNQVMLFSDCHRKYIRLRHMALTLTPNTPETRAALRQAYLDLAAYAAMGVQMIDKESEHATQD